LKQPNLASRLVCVGATPRQESSLYAGKEVLAALNLIQHTGNAIHGDQAHVLDLLDVELVLRVVNHGAEEEMIHAVDLDPKGTHQM